MSDIPGNHDLLAELAKENERLRVEIGEMKLVIESQDRGAVKLQAEFDRLTKELAILHQFVRHAELK